MLPVRLLFAAAALSLLAACAAKPVEDSPVKELGDFHLGYSIVVADNAKPVPPSRPATDSEWEASFREEIDARLRRYEGGRLYHLAVAVDAYALAVPGVPLVVSPKSVVVVSLTLFDDALQEKLNAEPKQLTIFEGSSGETFVGSGLTRTREQQMEVLTRNAVAAMEGWLEENAAWFQRFPPPSPEVVAEVAEAARKAAVASANLPAQPTAQPTAPAAPAN